MKVFETIVVGGGIIGATTAAMLSNRGVEVALLDGATCAGQGGSAYSGGIVRLYDADPVMMALGRHASHVRQHSRVGQVFDRSIRRTGVLYRAKAEDEEVIRAAMASVEGTRFLTASELKNLTDFVKPSADKIDLFETQGGHSDVRFATHSMAHMVREQGLVIEHAPVLRLEQTDQGLAEVHLKSGATLHARCVIIAAGPWTGSLIKDLLIEARSVPLGLMETPQAPHLPIIDMTVGTYVVPFGGKVFGIGCGPRHSADLPEDLPSTGPAHVADSLTKLAALTGTDTEATSLGVLNGVDAYTPDARPVIGYRTPSSPFYVITGMAGLGFKVAPAIADIAATEIHSRLRDLNTPSHALAGHFHAARFDAVPVTA